MYITSLSYSQFVTLKNCEFDSCSS